MNRPKGPFRGYTRRHFLAMTGGAAMAGGADSATRAFGQATQPAETVGKSGIEPFWGAHQSGIATPSQAHSYFAAFDLQTSKRDDVAGMLRAWTAAAANLAMGQPAQPLDEDADHPGSDSADALEIAPSRLTITFGFGAGLFVKEGKDRYGLASRRPESLVDLPKFNGDQLLPAQTDGDLSIQACADDPQVAFHAVRQLARLAGGAAQIRWAQTGFLPNFRDGHTPRNLMGFKDGTINPRNSNSQEMEKFVWAGAEAPDWMRGGSYLVVRKIRMALEHWDSVKLAFQEQVIGRKKYSGAPLGGKEEFEPMKLDLNDADGNPVIPENSHVRLAAPDTNDLAQILRRPYSYNDGVNFISERWPPWRQGMEYDAGLFFVSYQRDPRTGFIKIFDKMAKFDMLNQFVTHVGGGLFACPGGAAPGEFIGQKLFVNS